MGVQARCKSIHFFPSSAKRQREMTFSYFTERERRRVFFGTSFGIECWLFIFKINRRTKLN